MNSQTKRARVSRQVELADNSVQECIVRIYGALAEKARQEMEAAQAKAASCRAVADAANGTAETERKAGEAKAASCKNKAWDASVNWLDMKIKNIEEDKASLEATLKSDNKKKEKQLDKARRESLRCRRHAEQHMVLAHKKEYTEKKRIADEAVTAQTKKTSDTLADVQKQIKKQLKRRAKAEKELVKANAHAKTMHLMSTHADLIPRVRLIHDHFDKDKDGHIMDEEFFKFIRSLGRDVGAKPSKSPKRQKSRSNKVRAERCGRMVRAVAKPSIEHVTLVMSSCSHLARVCLRTSLYQARYAHRCRWLPRPNLCPSATPSCASCTRRV